MYSVSDHLPDLTIAAFAQTIPYSWGLFAFRGRYRFPLFELGTILSHKHQPTTLSYSDLCAFLISKRQRADFYWLLLRGMIFIGNRNLDVSEKTTIALRSQGLSQLAELISASTQEAECALGVSTLPQRIRENHLDCYGFCPKANLNLLQTSPKQGAEFAHIFARPKLASTRSGQPAPAADCMQLVQAVLHKQTRDATFDGHPLYRRVMPSAGSLCCIEAVLLSGSNAWFYDSSEDKFIPLCLDADDLSFLHCDLWLNAGSIQSTPSTSILLFANQTPFISKYGQISAHLQAIEAGIILADLWHLMPSYRLQGSILGNTMARSLIAPLREHHGDMQPVSALMLFTTPVTKA